jgi:protein-S-isoprenylcysteine O-methyltransferase Ste14
MPNAPENKADLGRRPSQLRVALAFAGMFWGFGALLFLPAGRLDWPAGWLYLAIVMIYMAINYAYLSRKNPELIASRMRLGKGTKTWDKIWMGGFMPVYIAVFVVAALDAGRFGWSPMSPFLWPVGLALFLPGAMLLSWSMGVNPFFEKTVRIQTERGHRVIDTGPYRFVRHPGYVGIVGWILSAPLMLGSWWAFLPAVLTVVALVVRTGLEDRTLREELSGYTEYAARVRYRLVPKLW